MIVDTSALVAVVLGEPDAESIAARMMGADELSVSATTLTEALIVVDAKQGPDAVSDLHALLAELEISVLSYDEEQAEVAHAAWRRFGKGRHTAALNLGDTFSYAACTTTGRPLLHKGSDFGQTDLPLA